MVAHKPTIIAVVNTLLLLRDGSIEAFGPRDEVARKFMRVLDTSSNLQSLPPRERQQ
jgi:ABC-type protease/lipase transport system fused ATPase/permease subunit